MTEKLYRVYVEHGADSLSLDEVRKVLAWQDSNPAEARQIRRRHSEAQREEADREDALAAWTSAGRDEREFEAHYKALKTEADTAELREMTEGARAAFRRHMLTSF